MRGHKEREEAEKSCRGAGEVWTGRGGTCPEGELFILKDKRLGSIGKTWMRELLSHRISEIIIYRLIPPYRETLSVCARTHTHTHIHTHTPVLTLPLFHTHIFLAAAMSAFLQRPSALCEAEAS